MEYKNPCTTVDVIVIQSNQFLFVKRNTDPFKDMWALPGGYINYGEETLEEAAIRELKEETGINVDLNDLYFFKHYSSPDRDPRGHHITHVFFTYLKDICELKADQQEIKEVKFIPLHEIPDLAFDHKKIIIEYLNKHFKLSI